MSVNKEHIEKHSMQTKRTLRYHKIPIISPGFIFVQKAFSLGLFSGELIFGGAYFWRGLLWEGILHFKICLACHKNS